MTGEMLWTDGELWIHCRAGRILFCPNGNLEGVQMGPDEIVDTEGKTIGWSCPSVVDDGDYPQPLPGYHWRLWEAGPPFNKRALDSVRNTPVGEGWVYTIEKDES